MDYTKGDWKLNTPDRPCFVVSDSKYICYVLRNEETEANANIITAAPKMYETLKEIEQNLRRCPVCKCLKENGHDYTCKLMQALAKAEGKGD